MPDKPFGHKLATHLAYRNHLPRRFKAGREADRQFIARVTADHEAAIAEVHEAHAAAGQADTTIIKGLRAETKRLRESLAKASDDLAKARDDLKIVTQERDDALQAAQIRFTEAEQAGRDLEEAREALATFQDQMAHAEATFTAQREQIADLQGRAAIASEPVGQEPAHEPPGASRTPAKPRTAAARTQKAPESLASRGAGTTRGAGVSKPSTGRSGAAS
jgi:hypothetical protein